MKSKFLIRISFFIGLVCILSRSEYACAQSKPTRILFLMDASSSMTYNWNTSFTRFNVATNILLHIVDSMYAINNEVEFAVRAYGTQYSAAEKNCFDTKLEVPFNFQNVQQIKTRLQYIKPYGFSPIAYSLEQAANNELSEYQKYDYSIIFITDGGESCAGDICKTFEKFLARKISIKPYIIGLDKNTNLQNYYTCLGNYIEVNTAADIQRAISTIVADHRQLLNKPKQFKLETKFSQSPVIADSNQQISSTAASTIMLFIKSGIIQPIKINKPTIRATALAYKPSTIQFKFIDSIKPPLIVREKNSLSKLNLQLRYLPNPQIKLIAKKINAFPQTSIKFPFSFPVEIQRTTDVFPYLKFKNIRSINTTKSNIKSGRIKMPKLQTATFVFTYDVPPPIVMPYLKASPYPRRYSYAYRLPNQKISFTRATVKFSFNIEAPKKIAQKDSTKSNKINSKTDEMKYSVTTKPSNETSIQVFFVGPKGQTYPKAKPLIEIIDATTKQPVLNFRRELVNGEPTIQTINAGTYDIFIREFNVARVYNFTVSANKLNQVTLVLEEGTLHFAYNNNYKKPVEFDAIVNRRFAAGASILQHCREVLHYDPGTYYVEINTLPTTKRSIEIEFFKEYLLQIDEPGKLQITNTNNIGKADLQCVLGDAFATFYTISVNGDLNKQLLQLQPGVYKISFPANANLPQAGKKTIDFKITSNQTSTIELK